MSAADRVVAQGGGCAVGRGIRGPAETVEELVDDLTHRGWLVEEGTVIRLTPEGSELYAALAAEVEQVRLQVARALPGEDSTLLVSLLRRLVDAFPPVPDTP